jgi:flotillin
VAEAEVLKAQYDAQTVAAKAQEAKIEAEKNAELVALAKSQKAKMIVDAEADAERRRIQAQGEASAIFLKLEAEARGQFEILQKKGQGFAEIVKACGDPQAAFQMMMLEHLDHLADTASNAISNIKFDKVVVWDPGTGANGKSATAGFLQGLAGSLPPMLQMMRDIGGVQMPEYFGKVTGDAKATAQEPPHAAPPAEPPKKK